MDLFRKKDIDQFTPIDSPLPRCLSVFDLIFLGVGAIIGAGIFVVTGIVAATSAGPGIVFSYILAGLVCGFAALSYAELAAAIGGCGSAYGYAYAGFGELIGWIVGWDLLLEYAISVPAIAVGWSGYFNALLIALHIHLPLSLLHSPLNNGIMDVLSLSIIIALTMLLCLGTKSSSRVNNVAVLIKLLVICLFIVISMGNVDPANWSPFLPFGWSGVINGAAIIFFSYIGFDAVSTAAEEMLNPQRDLPRGILGSLLICTILYMLVSGLLTGIVPYGSLNVASPISHALILLGYRLAAGIVGVGAVAGLTTVMLVMFYGLSRVFLAMARDGLLPGYFALLNPKTHAPVRIIVLCGVLMAVTAALLPITDLVELVNIGTLFAFTIVCGGVIVLRYTRPDLPRPFKVPLMPWIPLLGMMGCLYLICHLAWFTLIRFVVWLLTGVIVYFTYGRYHSALETRIRK